MRRVSPTGGSRVAGIALLGLVLAASLATGCWRASELRRERADRALAAGDPRIVVVPLNVAVRLAEGLEPAVEPVQRDLLAHLGEQGAQVSFLAVEDAEALWNRTVAALRSHDRNTASLENTTGTFVRAIRDVVPLDFVLMPALGYREARVERGYAIWDHVSRSLTARHQAWAATERVPAYSLHVQLYTPDGRLFHQRWGGLDIVPRSDLDDRPGLTDEQVRASAEFLRAGVAIALERGQPR